MSMTAGAAMNLDTDDFLARYWQQQPLLIRQAVANFVPPVSSDELAGLALEESVESRIIESVGGNWQLFHGPFSESDYTRPNPWTLLVQAVDHYVLEVAQLRKLVDFIPGWRVDDVMVSYAVDGGSVGPHYDNYDVFLLQGEGRRRWQIGQHCDANTPRLPQDDLHILCDFDVQAEYVLEPGDMLYVPPGVAHWGIAEGECTTFSIGFRAPRIDDLVARFADALLATHAQGEAFFRDSNLEAAARPGEIRVQDIARMRAQLRAALDQAVDERWFGELVTEPRYDAMPAEDELAESLHTLHAGATALFLAPESKLAWQATDNGIDVFANGASRSFSAGILELITTVCGEWELRDVMFASARDNAEQCELLCYLLATGCAYVE
ncbi:hypothetical protein A3709_09680 [Halioglobus sp. HI00S01]|uniref:cupin domain-containing protein n=1 Tax=Halioglobus sp. HI00S01 TaxID=1822214 RepID=UPI0007C30DDB|nr:cupin domain-containing protein [Halioglobus sp. HI00S01]KZX53392.1 hypothetical protein A3709_09680 [Halioglobus sp. HI00S01]